MCTFSLGLEMARNGDGPICIILKIKKKKICEISIIER